MPKIRNLASRRPGGSRPDSLLRGERPVTVRLDQERLALVTALAILDETTVAEQIRLASEGYIRLRLDDPGLPMLAESAVERFRRSFDPLLRPASNPDADQPASQTTRKPERDTATEKPITLRLDQLSVDYFTSLALLDDTTLADQLRSAIDVYTDQRRQDPELEDRIRETRTGQDELLARLTNSA